MIPGVLAVIVLDFDPYLHLGDRSIRWETLGIAAAVLLGILVAALLAGRTPGHDALIGEEEPPEEEREGPWHLRRDDLLFILLGAVPGAVVLGRLGYGLLHMDYYGGNWRALLDPAQGSLELTLAVVGGTLTGIYVAALLDAPVGRWLHVAIAPLLLVLGLGKAAQALGGSGQGTRDRPAVGDLVPAAGAVGQPRSRDPGQPLPAVRGGDGRDRPAGRHRAGAALPAAAGGRPPLRRRHRPVGAGPRARRLHVARPGAWSAG